jgi:MFS family permease
VAVLLLGGLVTAYLTLALIAAAHGPAADMARRMSLVSMTYTLTAVAGPLLAGGVVQQLGGNGLMWTLVAFALALTLALAHRRFSLAARSA